MRRASFADMNCSIARSLEVVGEWWTLLILRDAFFGVRRFEDFHDRLGIARNVLAARLDTLVDTEILERRPYDEARGRYDYVLTAKGRRSGPSSSACASGATSGSRIPATNRPSSSTSPAAIAPSPR